MPSRLIRSGAVFFVGIALGFAGGWGAFSPAISEAQSSVGDSSAQALQAQIDASNAKIKEIRQEIARLETQLGQTTTQKKTLQNAIAQLNLNIKKIAASITLTQAQIAAKDARIGVLAHTIATTTGAVNREQDSAAGGLRDLDTLDRQPLVLELINGETLSDFFTQAVQISGVQEALQLHIAALNRYKNNLQEAKTATQNARQELADFKRNLSSQRQGLVTAKAAQAQLLTETKSKESNYQKLIAQKKAEEAQFEDELNRFQAQLKGISLSEIPPPSAILAWPLAGTITVTQYFGNTPFASQNPQVYNGHGHSGIDLAARPGTPVIAAADGTVAATGNTDAVCPYGSFGKYVFIRHPSGLATLYAHLGTISVSNGQAVSQGQAVGYSDTTGYATGPHLHFGVYASFVTKVETLPTAVRCPYIIPIAPLSGYLNPLSYLPSVPR